MLRPTCPLVHQIDSLTVQKALSRVQNAGSFHHLLDLVAQAPALRNLELQAPYDCHPSDAAAHATLATFRQLSSLKMSRFTLGDSILLQQVKVMPSHPLATLTELEFASCGVGALLNCLNLTIHCLTVRRRKVGPLACTLPNLWHCSIAQQVPICRASFGSLCGDNVVSSLF